MQSMKMKKGAVLAVIVVGAAACVWAQPKKPTVRADAVSCVPADTVISLDVKTRTIKPYIALIPPGAALELRVTGLAAGQSLELDFRAQGGRKGPFAKTPENVRGRYLFRADSALTSGLEDVGKVEAWKYDVILRDKGEADVWAIDPMIVVRD